MKLEFRGSRITSDAGLLAYRELDNALGLSAMAGEMLADARTGRNSRHALVGLLRQSVFGRLAGYEDVNDTERLRHDPAMRWIVGGKAASGRAASPAQMGRFETHCVAAEENLSALADLSGQWIDRVHSRRPAARHRARYLDSSVSPTHGGCGDRASSGPATTPAPATTRCSCSTSSVIWNAVSFRPGNVHSADGWQDVLAPVVARYRGKVLRLYLRADAAFAMPGVYQYLEAERNRIYLDPYFHQPGSSTRGVRLFA